MKITAELSAALAGRYVVEREIGRGGMAVVYLARDTKHDRLVAVKVLNPELGAMLGAERFLAEIRTTATLQHPNLLPLFDSGEAGGLLYYVMPYLEGESLRARIDREGQLAVEDAVRIAIGIANALAYAHAHGVIHRDLKPENVLLQHGQPVVLDFGVALALRNAAEGRRTQTGISVGTPQYMSPEQAAGEKIIDARADIYALGTLTYEMLAGDPPHTGPSAQAIIARVMAGDVRPVTSSRPSVPSHVANAVQRALARVPADRFPTATDFARAIENQTTSAAVTTSAPAPAVADQRRHRALTILPWGLFASMVAVAAWGWTRTAPETVALPTTRFEVAKDEDLAAAPTGTNITLSPDGSHLLYRRRDAGGGEWVLRNLSEMSERPVSGVGTLPRFSPDGRWLVFVQSGGVRKVRVAGGSSVVVVDNGVRPVWGEGGRIVFERDSVLWSVMESGGAAERLTTLDPAARDAPHRWADFLPGGSAIVFSIRGGGGESDDELAALRLSDREVRRLGVRGVSPHYIAGGYLVYGRFDGTASAVRFNADRLEVSGPELQVVDRLIVRRFGAVELTVAANGMASYIEGSINSRLLLVDRDGQSRPQISESRRFGHPRISPDGSRIAVRISEPPPGTGTGVWVLDIASQGFRRVSKDSSSHSPVWTGDGRSLVWLHQTMGLRMQRLDGTSDETTPTDSASTRLFGNGNLLGVEVDRAGPWIVAVVGAPRSATGTDFYLARLDSMPLAFRPLLVTRFNEQSPAISPNGTRIAYASNASGRTEVYVDRFPSPSSTPLRVSSGGGIDPAWAPDGRSLVYRRGNSRMMSVRFGPSGDAVGTDSLFALERFTRPLLRGVRDYDVAPDGRQFLMIEPDPSRRLVVVMSWQEELRRRFAELGTR